MRCPWVVIAVFLYSWLLAAACEAHAVNLSSSTISIAGEGIDVEWRMSGLDATLIEADNAESGLSEYILARSHLSSGLEDTPCIGRYIETQRTAQQRIVKLRWHCPVSMENLIYRVSLFAESEPDARHIILISEEKDIRQAVLTADIPQIKLTRHPPDALLSTAQRYMALGIEHIFEGYDHIAFLVVIMLWASRLLPVISAISAFTVAHSITLALASMNLLVLPSQFVEPLIALSIVYGATENLLSHDMSRRWKTTGVLGLIHGFGFASVLSEVGLPNNALITALASFNLGIELGQVVIATLVFIVLKSLDRVMLGTVGGRSSVVVSSSFLLGGLGIYWFCERVFIF
jgi:hydrogenase/urease accessory protein HupE